MLFFTNVQKIKGCDQFPVDLVTFNEETLNGKPHFSCSAPFSSNKRRISNKHCPLMIDALFQTHQNKLVPSVSAGVFYKCDKNALYTQTLTQ